MSEIFAAQTTGSLYKAQLLDYYYERRAESAIGKGARFVITSVAWGKSDLVTVNKDAGWNIADIPTDYSLSDLKKQFAKSPVICSVQGKVITINATMPQDQLTTTEAHDFNTLMLLDAEDKAIAVLATQQDTVYKGKNYSIIMTIEQAGS